MINDILSYSTYEVTVKIWHLSVFGDKKTTLFGLILSNSLLGSVGGHAGCV